ncbi:unnamed protein product [Macrosiphum euphorbiae]|uniref:DUF4371 domain-containing protein n=1 Tax=Macrosiphum euphorbiae TaxID=13131 RepID=A0AAV0W505_9HEMI|nr:unnamed protein product [Macrosiphum euphorbiae]
MSEWFIKKQQIMFTKIPQENEAAVKVSYVLSELIAKHSKPFTEGDFIKTCLIKTAEIICPGNLKAFQNISLTRNTVAERITELACNLSNQIKIKIPTFEYFSIACDESTDIGGTAQLAVFFRACDMEFNIFEELLEIIPMFDTTTGEDVFVSVVELLKKYDLPLEKLSSDFYSFVPTRYVEIRRFASKIISMFSSTYQCEQLFPLMNSNKSPVRSRLTDTHLNAVLKVASSNNMSPEIEKLVGEKRCQISSKKNY